MWKILRPESTFVFDDPLVKKSLDRYIDVANNCKLAKFKVAKKTPATFDESSSLEMLWEEHARCKEKFCNLEQELDKTNFSESCISLEKSYFDLKLEIASRILQKCPFSAQNVVEQIGGKCRLLRLR